MGRTVLITGASRGIGRAAAELFAAERFNVVINYLHSEGEAQSLAAELSRRGCGAAALRADVADRAQVESMVQSALDTFGAIDVLVNNAGIAQQRLFTDITPAEWDRMMDVHVKGTFHCCQCVLPQMIHRKCGAIVNVSSMWGQAGASCEVHYSTAKAAVIGFTKALAKELGPSGIRVNCVAPGVIDTGMNAGLSQDDRCALIGETPLMRLGTPFDAARAIVFLASESADFITGQVLAPNGGFVI
ncbi:MAG: 3-oxoacyl-ACP reductase FabG [Clostridia bacterium]|nr:3-oxoacyl-ACP reductase FabG [Clostridia bacterium]MDR3644954.1 3-oxoacyl-ACP reductase FabG [Clostridia bacterium]